MPIKTLDDYLKPATTHTKTKERTTAVKYRITGFYKETQFQETPLGKIPKQWETIHFHKIFDYTKGRKPNDLKEEEVDGHLPYLTTDYLRTGVPSNYAKLENNLVVVDEGDILLLWDGSNAGEFFLGKRGILASTMVKLLPKAKDIDLRFYFYFLKMLEPYLKSVTKGTGIPHVEKSVLKSLLLVKPAHNEQWGIAEVLSSVDRAIGATGRIIERLECLKRGLMQELLTKGIGHKEYKQTPIGKIPKEWVVKRIGEVAKVRRGASPRPKGDPRYFGGDIPWIKISDLAKYRRGFYLVKTDETLTEEGKKKSVYLEDGALIVSNSGTIGRPAIIKTGKGGCIHDGFVAIEPIKEVDKYYLFYFFEFKQEELQVKAQRGTQGNMNTNLWRSIKLPLPPYEEQLIIVNILQSIDKWIEIEMKRREELERLKRGLMKLLLTGRVRVRVEEVS